MKLRFLDRIEIEDRKVKLIYAFYDTALLYQIQLGLEGPTKANPIPPWMTAMGASGTSLATSDLGDAPHQRCASTGHRKDSSMVTFAASGPGAFSVGSTAIRGRRGRHRRRHNGLVASGYLAKAGLRVAVVEAADTPGGMTASGPLIPEAPAHIVNSCAVDIISMLHSRIPPISSCGNTGSGSSSPTRATCRCIPTGRRSRSGATTRVQRPRSSGTHALTRAPSWSSLICSM